MTHGVEDVTSYHMVTHNESEVVTSRGTVKGPRTWSSFWNLCLSEISSNVGKPMLRLDPACGFGKG